MIYPGTPAWTKAMRRLDPDPAPASFDYPLGSPRTQALLGTHAKNVMSRPAQDLLKGDSVAPTPEPAQEDLSSSEEEIGLDEEEDEVVDT